MSEHEKRKPQPNTEYRLSLYGTDVNEIINAINLARAKKRKSRRQNDRKLNEGTMAMTDYRKHRNVTDAAEAKFNRLLRRVKTQVERQNNESR